MPAGTPLVSRLRLLIPDVKIKSLLTTFCPVMFVSINCKFVGLLATMLINIEFAKGFCAISMLFGGNCGTPVLGVIIIQ